MLDEELVRKQATGQQVELSIASFIEVLGSSAPELFAQAGLETNVQSRLGSGVAVLEGMLTALVQEVGVAEGDVPPMPDPGLAGLDALTRAAASGRAAAAPGPGDNNLRVPAGPGDAEWGADGTESTSAGAGAGAAEELSLSDARRETTGAKTTTPKAAAASGGADPLSREELKRRAKKELHKHRKEIEAKLNAPRSPPPRSERVNVMAMAT
mmetsp:Transcript_25801/g.84920  ORF Transcript_25801/g.84920 Transcript_25801/m.84920 type:complete len:212 (+) Transcript_25801:2-637(+)